MGLYILRLVVILICGWAGTVIGMAQGSVFYGIVGAVLGLGIGGLLGLGERYLRTVPLWSYLYALGGLVVGLSVGTLISHVMGKIPLQSTTVVQAVSVLIYAVCAYLGVVLGIWKGPELHGQEDGSSALGGRVLSRPKILDTSVIIDGRVADICETGFLEGPLLIPQFVLKELQQIAGSSDALKRNRGRRGLEVLQRIQKNADIPVRIIDHDFPNIREVDAKLVALGKALKGTVLTNDFNLNKVAELQGVPVLNIHQLANAVKPVVLPGEVMHVCIIKEGKEYGQGVAYLEDGTMVVVDHARKYLGKNVDVSVTSVLQTTAGRIIFTRLKEESNKEVAVGGR